MRTAGRIFNPEYRRFANTLSEAHLHDRNARALLLRYDYEVSVNSLLFYLCRSGIRNFFILLKLGYFMPVRLSKLLNV